MHTSIGWMREQLEAHSQDIGVRMFNRVVEPAPHYVISKEIMALLEKETVHRSLSAMVVAGIKNIPFDPILIEYRDDTYHNGDIYFVRLQSKPFIPVGKGLSDEGNIIEHADLYAYVLISTKRHYDRGVPILGTSLRDPIRIDWASPKDAENYPFQAYYGINPAASDKEEMQKQAIALAAIEGMGIAMLMLNTRGIEKEHVQCEKLDRARVKAGKPKIGSYSILKIGTIYDREGRAYDRQTTGRHMPVHWRAGHVRNQKWGPGRTKVRLIYIQPVLVNFKPEDGVSPPTPKHEVVL